VRAALALVAMLAACAAGGPLPDMAGKPAAGTTVKGADGIPLAASVWGKEDAATVILALHGYGDYGPSTFGAAATYWATRGIRTYAYDQRGFGRNPSRGRWPGADRLIDDLRAVAGALRARHTGARLVVLGHSMGGGVALAAAPGLDADMLVLVAPAIWGGPALDPMHRAAAWAGAALMPDRRLTGRGIVRIRASDNIEALRALARDPLYLRPPSPREMMGLVRVMDRAAAAAPRVTLPALLLTGAKDEILPESAVEAVLSRLRGPRAHIRYPNGWHLLLRDCQAPRVWRDLADRVLAPDPVPAQAAAPATSPAREPAPPTRCAEAAPTPYGPQDRRHRAGG